MINGAHVVIYSQDSDADRDFLRKFLKLPHVDVGHGWLIFGLPPSEVAVHPSDKSQAHELYLMCDDIEAFVKAATKEGLACGEIEDAGWGRLMSLTLPGGGPLGVYEPRHARPPAVKGPKKKAKKKATKKKATKKKATKKKATKKKAAKKKPAKKKAKARPRPSARKTVRSRR